MSITQLIEQNDEALTRAPKEQQRPSGHTYGQILRSSVLVGGSSVLNVGIGILRTKAVALLLGPAGFGLFGLYNSIATLTQTISGMGINSSGVRQIAEAVGSEDSHRIALTATVLKRISLALGLIGAIILISLSHTISQLTFRTKDHSNAVALLGIAVFFTSVSAGQTALIQGTRRIADLAKLSVLGSFYGLLASIPLIYFFNEQGVVPSLVAVAAMTAATSSWYSRKIKILPQAITDTEVVKEVGSLIKLGVAFMVSGLMTMGVAYAVRIIVLRGIGYAATGLYQSAWTLGGLYVSIILQAMGADFYPRLTAHSEDNVIVNRLVNEQAEVGLLLAGPGVLGTLALAPLVLTAFYSPKFEPAVEVLRWICLGSFIQVITWPMGFIIIAKARQGLFMISELAWGVVSLGLTKLLVDHYGLNGAGLAFFISYIFHGIFVYGVVFRLSDFRWSNANKRRGLPLLILIGVAFYSFYVLPVAWASFLSGVITIISGAYSLSVLSHLIPRNRISGQIKHVLNWFNPDGKPL